MISLKVFGSTLLQLEVVLPGPWPGPTGLQVGETYLHWKGCVTVCINRLTENGGVCKSKGIANGRVDFQ